MNEKGKRNQIFRRRLQKKLENLFGQFCTEIQDERIKKVSFLQGAILATMEYLLT